MHLFKEQAVRDYAAAAKTIPVIDYGPYFAGEQRELERLAEQVADACENIGFFYALNHGVPDEQVDVLLPPLAGSLHCRSSKNSR